MFYREFTCLLGEIPWGDTCWPGWWVKNAATSLVSFAYKVAIHLVWGFWFIHIMVFAFHQVRLCLRALDALVLRIHFRKVDDLFTRHLIVIELHFLIWFRVICTQGNNFIGSWLFGVIFSHLAPLVDAWKHLVNCIRQSWLRIIDSCLVLVVIFHTNVRVTSGTVLYSSHLDLLSHFWSVKTGFNAFLLRLPAIISHHSVIIAFSLSYLSLALHLILYLRIINPVELFFLNSWLTHFLFRNALPWHRESWRVIKCRRVDGLVMVLGALHSYVQMVLHGIRHLVHQRIATINIE